MSSNTKFVNLDISVVMGVYNGAATLRATVESVLSQDGVDFEFIIVNDGSTDQTGVILDSYAALDKRVHVLHQANGGLTRALIIGCAQARGRFIARHDAGGDVSVAGRFACQRDYLDSHPTAAMVSCGTQFVGPEGDELYVVTQDTQVLRRGLRDLSISGITGPSHHGSVMMRREAYDTVGGYRTAFTVAQDLDLWLRMTEIAMCDAISSVLYRARLSHGSISASRRDEQIRTAETILKCAAARRAGCSDAAIIAKWEHESAGLPRSSGAPEKLATASFYRFLGGIARKKNPTRAAYYYAKSAREYLLHCVGGVLNGRGEGR